MDYKEKYEQALERAKEFVCKGNVKVAEYIFPELKESEDEEIRKEIISIIRTYRESCITEGNHRFDNCIAWLEKQKTSEEALQYLRENHSSSEMSDFQAAMNIAVAKAYDKGYNDGLEKQGEQKPNPCDGCVNRKGCINCENGELREIEQKPAWSEEDERIYQSIMDDTVQENQLNDEQTNWLRDIKYRYFPQSKQEWSEEDEEHIDSLLKRLDGLRRNEFERTRFAINEDEYWLKSLKDRVQPQQEWSKKDNQYLCGLIGLIEQSKAELPITLKGKAADNCIDWLKSLKERCTWKPSDEQTEALDGICSYIRNQADWEISQDTIHQLYSLSEQLKKLKG